MTIKVYFTEDQPARFTRWTLYALLSDWSQLPSLAPELRVCVSSLPAGISFAVCAPAGSGKTARAKDVLRALGLPETTPVVDEWTWNTPRTPGALHLTNEDRARAELSRLGSPSLVDLAGAIDRAAAELPEWAEIQVSVENGAAGVVLINRDGATIHDATPLDHDTSLTDAVIECIEVAQGTRPANVPPEAYTECR